jgi:hypothetical protein
MDRDFIPKQFIGLFDSDITDRQIGQLIESRNSGRYAKKYAEVNGAPISIKGKALSNIP